MQDKLKKRVILFLVSFIFSLYVWGSPLDSSNPWGKRADEISIDTYTIMDPPVSKSGESYVTQNQFGFDIFKSESTWVVEEFLNSLKPNNVVLDSGAGYGFLTRQALDQGAIVISNDLSDKHLLYNLKVVKPEQKTHLYLNDKDIRTLNFSENSFDQIMFHRVLHFFNGKDIEEILKKAHYWLKPGGKIYIVMLSKDHVLYRDKIQYDNTKKWPGENLIDVETHMPKQAYSMGSKKLHVMSSQTLEIRLKDAGFKIERSGFVAIIKGKDANRDGKEAVGVIGVK